MYEEKDFEIEEVTAWRVGHELFADRRHAEDRVALRRRAQAANEALRAGKSILECVKLYVRSPECYGGERYAILGEMTKDTKLVISYWQCRDTPGYCVCHFDEKGIYVSGHAGSWSGPYGNYVDLGCLVRYANDTLARFSANEIGLRGQGG